MEARSNGNGHLPRLSLDTKIPAKALARRNAISYSSTQTYPSRPRLERRGGISFENTDRNAVYVRMLGDVAAPKHAEVAKDKSHHKLPDSEQKLLDGKETSEDYKPKCRLRFHSLHRPTRRNRPRSRCSPENASILDDLYSGQAKKLLKTVGDWNFNIFTLDKLTNGRPLFYLTIHLFQEHKFLERFQLDPVKVMRCISLIEDSYHSNNPYHHAVHAADVTQAMHCYLQESQLKLCVTPMETMLALLSAATHDIDHPGVNQAFLIATNNHLANLYQNTSVLENHHWRTALGIIKESCVFDHFTSKQWEKLECQLRSLILATDITRQQEFLSQFKRHLDNQDFDLKARDDHRHFVMQIALKCADICNVCRHWELSKKWSYSVCDEFFRQGKFEKKLGIPVTPNCDRNNTTVAKIQSGFIQFVVGPLFQEWFRFLPTLLGEMMMNNLLQNRESWQNVLKEAEVEKQRSIARENDIAEKENTHHLLDECLSNFSPVISTETLVTADGVSISETEIVTETRYKLDPDEVEAELPIRLQLRRHSLPPSVPKIETPSYLVRRQSFPHVLKISPRMNLNQSTSYQHIRDKAASLDKISGNNRSHSLEGLLSQRPRITTLSPSIELSRLTSLSPTPEEAQKYLQNRRASFPFVQKMLSKTTYTSTKLSSRTSREPLASIPVDGDSNRLPQQAFHNRGGRHHDGGIKRKEMLTSLPERLRHKRMSDPGASIPSTIHMHAHPDIASEGPVEDNLDSRLFRPIQLQ
ncbi:high affinity 3',5'-cyclic-AMP phosphodiesterase 7A-like isoform X4 [Tubulanus polymorphus]|uniref:high affinity 3',5'-cyclic-AMP phosphodiesterase 7A-like isoform X4 n=1 Tax=Tubulanus polymorphus TaxID=672921 RepID=UPI003DA2DE10